MIELILAGAVGATAAYVGRKLYKYLKIKKMMNGNKKRMMAYAGLTGKHKSNYKRTTKLQPSDTSKIEPKELSDDVYVDVLGNLKKLGDKWPHLKNDPLPTTAEELNKWREQNKFINPDQEAQDRWRKEQAIRDSEKKADLLASLMKEKLENKQTPVIFERLKDEEAAKVLQKFTEKCINSDLEIDKKTKKRIMEEQKKERKILDELKRQLANPKPVYNKFLKDIVKNDKE